MQQIVILILLFSFHSVYSEDNYTTILHNSIPVALFQEVRFFLHTRESSDEQELYVWNNYTLQQSSYSPSRITKFVTHGWMSTFTSNASQLVVKALLVHADYNVISVGWGELAQNTSYGFAAAQTEDVGKTVAEMINFVVQHGSDPNQMSLIGHSLGAQVMGIAGKYTNVLIAHLVGLDPARPGFLFKRKLSRVNINDAGLVEIVHTSLLGLASPTGDVDYYPNGGRKQPGCGSDLTSSCSHARAYNYYAESLTNPEKWYAIRCKTYALFKSGYCNGNAIVPFPRWSANFKRPRGVYMLYTNDTEPYGLGMDGVENDKNFSIFALVQLIYYSIKNLIGKALSIVGL